MIVLERKASINSEKGRVHRISEAPSEVNSRCVTSSLGDAAKVGRDILKYYIATEENLEGAGLVFSAL